MGGYQCSHALGNFFFKVRELSGIFANCRGNLDIVNVRELSENFENTRFKSIQS